MIAFKKILEDKAFFFTTLYILIAFVIFKLFPDVFMVTTMMMFFTLLLDPVVRFLERIKFGRHFSRVIALLLFFFVMIYSLYVIIPPVFNEFGNFIEFITGVFENKVWKDYIKSPALIPVFDKIMSFLEPKLNDLLNYVFSLATTNFLSVTTVIVFTLFGLGYALFYTREIADFFIMIYPKSARTEAKNFLLSVYSSMGRYIRVIFINALIIGVSYWIVFEIFDLKYSAIISLWAFVTNFIPIVGVVLEYVPVLLFSLTLGLKGFLLIVLFAIIIHAVAFVVFIQMMKGLEKLNPVYIILSILFFGKLFGMFGSFVGVPLALFFKVFWRKFLEPLLETG
ncbi:AI-2E family transporter [Thermotoga sp. KOL6]|uniref:AI-2E family transporter n=1 Tax=Thermotoga sp. KOL6 TaxID=126741 RepID=UPI000C78B075|nr:AI-2E family transporter [Thermotoga sp. KOL6]PLV60002.1 hypothetical protein AS005_01545 [Thermotoga sp. KOL6]